MDPEVEIVFQFEKWFIRNRFLNSHNRAEREGVHEASSLFYFLRREEFLRLLVFGPRREEAFGLEGDWEHRRKVPRGWIYQYDQWANRDKIVKEKYFYDKE